MTIIFQMYYFILIQNKKKGIFFCFLHINEKNITHNKLIVSKHRE